MVDPLSYSASRTNTLWQAVDLNSEVRIATGASEAGQMGTLVVWSSRKVR